ncbi:hypothetical protein B0T22DRAFT_460259 [Podospora appendiculata]|uniref:Archaemetzincin-2 n=1 Tax=Podospora appendiculata TaxID=314037 RepID=A0AAE1CCM7_9PEZI|nr:hypothetical protein B0T22DRAFT_460259 [Podospora appendiculata]
MPSNCPHTHLQTDVSSHAATANFSRAPISKRIAATTPSGRETASKPLAGQIIPSDEPTTFPAPLVLPDDALALDPKEPPQSLRSWVQEKTRNPLTADRKTIYIAHIPTLTKSVAIMAEWSTPTNIPTSPTIPPPTIPAIAAYLSAFYHPLPVKILPQAVSFVPWPPGGKRPSPRLTTVGLQIGNTVTQVPTRACPDGIFPRQLGLNPILDAAIDALPADAHSLVLVVEQDLYEDEDDDFCCGRAYGGSRICVVSAARYHPALDKVGDVDREHMWPASHCGEFVAALCNGGVAPRRKGKGVIEGLEREGIWATPLGAAMAAARAQSTDGEDDDIHGLWLSRVARTVSHELGHCFTLAHCVYYACVMQSTAGVHEDLRQPPYLCPVCLAKVTRAVGAVAEPGVDEAQIAIQRYRALREFCEGWLRVGMFAGFHAWLGKRLERLEL